MSGGPVTARTDDAVIIGAMIDREVKGERAEFGTDHRHARVAEP